MEIGIGSTCQVVRIAKGLVLKSPRVSLSETAEDDAADIKEKFEVEKAILNILQADGMHSRIISFYGVPNDPAQEGLLLEEAKHGNLQAYLTAFNDSIDLITRLKWCKQAAEAIQYIHSKGVVHCDLRPENFLLFDGKDEHPDIRLADFGGSCCGKIDGGGLPDWGFADPNDAFNSTFSADVFSLGSVFYAILTGHWPFQRGNVLKTREELDEYADRVNYHFRAREWPEDTSELSGGEIIIRCWEKAIESAAVVAAWTGMEAEGHDPGK